MTEIFNKKYQTDRRKDLRKSMPKGEKLLWYELRSKKMGYKFRRQFGINNYIVDFYCPKLKLVIEIDGWTHDNKEETIYDIKRQREIESLGIIVKRFHSYEIFEDIGYVVRRIYNIYKELDNNLP